MRPLRGQTVLEPEQVKQVKFPPFTKIEELPKPQMDSEGRLVKSGAARYFLNEDGLIAIYNKGKGIAQKLVRRLKLTADNDKELRAQLKKQGVPTL